MFVVRVGGAATAPVGRAEDHAVDWRAACLRRWRTATRRDCERRDRQQDGPNAPGWVASEERAATSVRRVGGEATVWALDCALNVKSGKSHGLSAQTVASAAARLAGRGPFLTLRRCEGERAARDELDFLRGTYSDELWLIGS